MYVVLPVERLTITKIIIYLCFIKKFNNNIWGGDKNFALKKVIISLTASYIYINIYTTMFVARRCEE